MLQIPADAGIAIEKTLADPSHYSLWGTPEALRDCVVLIQKVRS